MAKVYRGTQAKSQFVDTSDVFEKAQTDIALGEVVRETKRQKWKDDYEAVRKEQQDIESTGSEQFNNFVGNWSGAIQDQALTLKNGLESGNISSKDYTSNWGNLKSSNDELISSQKTYKARADKVYEDFNNGTGSLANVQALNAYNQKMNLKGLQAVTNENGGIDLFDKESKKIINTFGLSNLTNVNVQKFDRAGEAKALVDQFGTKVTRDAQGNQMSTVEIGGMMFDLSKPGTQANTDFNKAIEESAMSSLLAGNNMASYLIDGNLGYTLDGEEGDPKTLTVKEDGTIDISEEAQAVAVEEFTKDIRNALPFEEKAPLPQKRSPYKEKVGQVRETEISTIGNVDKVVSGTNAESQQAIDTMISNINRKNQKSRVKTRYENIQRSDDGETITVVYTDEDGVRQQDPYPAEGSERILMEMFYPENELSFDELAKDYEFGTLTTKDEQGNTIDVSSSKTKEEKGKVNFAENKYNPKDPKSNNIQTEIKNAKGEDAKMTRLVSSILNSYTDEDFNVTYKDAEGLFSGDNIVVTNSKDEEEVIGNTDNPGEVSSALQKYINKINTQQGGARPTFVEWKKQNPEGTMSEYKKTL
tara:strand:+ start:16317 stop:18083 length:1767 start_codon:yes stop_codon:yes gene_type:complete